jgi:hypothetical protein
MRPDLSQWHSSARYVRVEDGLTASGLAWEWLRRIEAYGHDYRVFAKAGADRRPLVAKIQAQWGLQFPRRSLA